MEVNLPAFFRSACHEPRAETARKRHHPGRDWDTRPPESEEVFSIQAPVTDWDVLNHKTW